MDLFGGHDVKAEQPTAINELRRNIDTKPANEDSEETDQANDLVGGSVMPPTYEAQATTGSGVGLSKLPDQEFRGAQMSSTSEAGTDKASSACNRYIFPNRHVAMDALTGKRRNQKILRFWKKKHIHATSGKAKVRYNCRQSLAN